jgi:hypothetical protein
MQLKAVCVPLMGASLLSPATFKTTVDLLNHLTQLMREIPPESLSANLISYIFLPLSTILQRNSSNEIPDQILEKILGILALLVESWWWTCDVKIWEQIFMLCGAVVAGVESKGGKGKVRDDETKQAAVSCLKALVRPRTAEEATRRRLPAMEVENRFSELQLYAYAPTFVPVVGRTMEAVLESSMSPHPALQHISLDVIAYLIELYLPDPLVPSVLPGVVSTMAKICLGLTGSKGWSNGEIVARALEVIQVVTIKAVSDEICMVHGALRRVLNLDDLVSMSEPPESAKPPSFGTARTESWLRGTATQLHIAFNSLTPLLSHPNSSALRALLNLSASILRATPLSLNQSHPLLLSFLLSLSLSDYSSVSSTARQSLLDLLSRSEGRFSLQQILVNQLGNNLSALPRLISTQTDAKITHTAGLVEAVCRLATKVDSHPGIPLVGKGVGKLLGPSGGIEKWGWSLLAVLELVEPPVVVTHHSSAQLVLEADTQLQHLIAFPELFFRNLSTHEAKTALINMFHALGAASSEAGLYAVGWFFRIGYSATSSDSVAALWCACKLLEGIGFVSLSEMPSRIPPTKRLEKECKLLARSIAEIWDQPDPTPKKEGENTEDHEQPVLVQHQKGLIPLHDTLKITHPTKPSPTVFDHQPNVHRVLCLQLLAISAGICQERFSPLFIYILYPVLHSLVSPASLLSATALATLDFITASASYASPANLLLSNFDYVLDSVSRRLSQRWLDIDATKVLCVMIRLVGPDIVEKAGDVVEECFDRLDEFHGYGIIVDGLIEVLYEVLKVIEIETKLNPPKRENTPPLVSESRKANLDDFWPFLQARFDHLHDSDEFDCPVPQEPWGKAKAREDGTQTGDEIKPTPMSDELPPTVIQSLTKQIISRAMYFLSHESPVVRSKILHLLSLAVPVLPKSVLLPSIHDAWPFILNRMGDAEAFVVSAGAELVETLAEHVGDFMFRRIWDDVWPRFRGMLRLLETAETASAMVRRGENSIGTESAYTESHRLYRSLLKTMAAAMKGVHQHESSFWEVIVAFRRFLSSHAHNELQQHAIDLYIQASKQNPDAVWLLLTVTMSDREPCLAFLKQQNWEIDRNAMTILQSA